MSDSKVYHDRTTGERIFDDQKPVQLKYSKKPSFTLAGVTNMMDNMGKL